MRTWLFLVALLAGGYAGYLAAFAKTSYSSYTPAQLDQLEAEHSRQVNRTSGDEHDVTLISLMLIREERGRLFKLQVAGGVAGLSLVTALVLSLVGRRRAASHDDEDSDGTPDDNVGSRLAERNRAAALLGVRPDAPRAVIEAALQAQLAERAPSQLQGLAPDLRQKVLQQREELLQAANLLLGRREIPFSPDGTQS